MIVNAVLLLSIWFAEAREQPEPLAVNTRFRPRYHFAAPYGWMNDPNGFSIYGGEYQLFYQYNPYSGSGPGSVHWGHAKSVDLINWEYLPIALWPDENYDKDGVFSGSAVVDSDILYLIYTGNADQQTQNLASSDDGVNFIKYAKNPIINGKNLQPNFRDPKVWRHNNVWYAILGNSDNNNANVTTGRVILFGSTDLIEWTELAVLAESDGSLGYMWECPDFFELDGKFVLLMSPQGIEPEGDRYKNLYQTGYIVGQFDYDTYAFIPETPFRELDFGHDLYASQTLLDNDGRRIMIAWMDMWDQPYPEREDGWSGAMTLPRELKLTEDGYILMRPISGLESLKISKDSFEIADAKELIYLKNNSAELLVIANEPKKVGLRFEAQNQTLDLVYEAGVMNLDRGGADGVRRVEWEPQRELFWRIYIDKSSVEVFCGEGEIVMTSRVFPLSDFKVSVLKESSPLTLTISHLDASIPPPPLIKNGESR